MQKKWIFLSVAIALAGCAADTSSQPKDAVRQAASDTAAGQDQRGTVVATIPAEFSEYTTVQLSGNGRCVAGAATDEDGLNQRPVAYLAGQSQGVQWSTELPLSPGTYQGRATHCIGTDKAIYVLVQSDTQPEQTLSQTLLRVLKLNSRDGEVLASVDVGPEGVSDAWSAWVEEGEERFRLQGDVLVIAGDYFRLATPEERKPFRVEIASRRIR
jgi:hypothetical protein